MEVREIREKLGWTQKKFAEYFNIPLSTVRNWEQGMRTPPKYVISLIERVLEKENAGTN